MRQMAQAVSRAVVALLALATAATWGACAKSLDGLAPFPCADDGSCPEGFSCTSPPGGDAGTACYKNLTCDAGAFPCTDKCVEVFGDDAANCGGCGVACPTGAACCKGVCAVLDADPSHCGSCDTVCENAKSCLSGECACKPEQTVCSGNCTDIQADPENCGECGKSCGNGACASGKCKPCQPYEHPCGDRCVTNSDPQDCGACGVSCGGQMCTGGVCGANTCNGLSYTCGTAGDIWYCGSSIGGCCKPDHPYFCDNAAAPCWNAPVDCTTIVDCGGGSYFGCSSGQTYDCGTMSCK